MQLPVAGLQNPVEQPGLVPGLQGLVNQNSAIQQQKLAVIQRMLAQNFQASSASAYTPPAVQEAQNGAPPSQLPPSPAMESPSAPSSIQNMQKQGSVIAANVPSSMPSEASNSGMLLPLSGLPVQSLSGTGLALDAAIFLKLQEALAAGGASFLQQLHPQEQPQQQPQQQQNATQQTENATQQTQAPAFGATSGFGQLESQLAGQSSKIVAAQLRAATQAGGGQLPQVSSKQDGGQDHVDDGVDEGDGEGEGKGAETKALSRRSQIQKRQCQSAAYDATDKQYCSGTA
jgi:hypothetical protein